MTLNSNSTMTLVLVHGFREDASYLRPMEAYFSDLGYRVLVLDLPTRYGTLTECVDVMEQQLGSLLSPEQAVCFIAHSFGGLIVRRYLKQSPREALTCCVFIGSPAKGSKLATMASYLPFYNQVFKPLDDMQIGGGFDQLPTGVRLLNIAGTCNDLVLGRMFLPAQSDGRVEYASIETPDQEACISLPLNHKEIHQSALTFNKIHDQIKAWMSD